MVGHAVLLLLAVCAAACGGEATPTLSPPATVVFGALPASVGRVPQPGTPTTTVRAISRPGGWPLGATQPLTLGHCGLTSPLDFDGSLWDAAGGHDGQGGVLREDQVIELINATEVSITVIDPRTAVLRTPTGALILLERQPGALEYASCD